MSSSFLQVFLVELGSLHWISNHVLYLIHQGVTGADTVKHNQVQVLSSPVVLLICSQGWTSNLQMIVT